ncbi:tetratricopeptide repeat protein [soil metagenome]
MSSGLSDGRAALVEGETAGRRGDLRAAAAHFERALRMEPDLAAGHFNLGVCQAGLGNLPAACACFARAAKLAPRFAAAHERLGSVQSALGDYAGAVHSFQAALDLDPHNAQLLAWQGAALQLAGSFADAEACYRRALGLDARNADALCNLGKLCQATDRPQEAAAYLERALAVQPGHPAALAGMAMHLDREGRYEEALDRLAPYLQSQRPEIVIAYARALRRLGRHAQAAASLEMLLGGQRLPLDGRIQAHFSLGRTYEAQGRYDKAFSHFRQGNSLKSARYDRARLSDAVDRLMTTFDAPTLERLPRSGNDSEQPVFVIGLPRAGKSIVEQILASHPDVAGAGELTVIGDLSAEINERLGKPWPECAASLTKPILARAAQKYLQASSPAGRSALRIIDTLPGNFVHMGFIELLFPSARVVHVTRDARDVAIACWCKNFAGASLAFAFDLDDIAAYQAEHRRLMAHWRAVSKLRMTDVSYEALVQETESVSRQLIDFLGLPWHDDCLRYFEPGVPQVASGMQVREPLDRREIGRHARYEKYLDAIQGNER